MSESHPPSSLAENQHPEAIHKNSGVETNGIPKQTIERLIDSVGSAAQKTLYSKKPSHAVAKAQKVIRESRDRIHHHLRITGESEHIKTQEELEIICKMVAEAKREINDQLATIENPPAREILLNFIEKTIQEGRIKAQEAALPVHGKLLVAPDETSVEKVMEVLYEILTNFFNNYVNATNENKKLHCKEKYCTLGTHIANKHVEAYHAHLKYAFKVIITAFEKLKRKFAEDHVITFTTIKNLLLQCVKEVQPEKEKFSDTHTPNMLKLLHQDLKTTISQWSEDELSTKLLFTHHVEDQFIENLIDTLPEETDIEVKGTLRKKSDTHLRCKEIIEKTFRPLTQGDSPQAKRMQALLEADQAHTDRLAQEVTNTAPRLQKLLAGGFPTEEVRSKYNDLQKHHEEDACNKIMDKKIDGFPRKYYWPQDIQELIHDIEKIISIGIFERILTLSTIHELGSEQTADDEKTAQLIEKITQEQNELEEKITHAEEAWVDEVITAAQAIQPEKPNNTPPSYHSFFETSLNRLKETREKQAQQIHEKSQTLDTFEQRKKVILLEAENRCNAREKKLQTYIDLYHTFLNRETAQVKKVLRSLEIEYS